MHLNFSLSGLICLFFPPCALKNFFLRLLGWKVPSGCRVGFSWINAKHVELRGFNTIGHGNFIALDTLLLHERSYIQHLNRATGPLWLVLCENAGIGNQNKITRGPKGVSWGHAMLKLGKFSKITVGHIIDCTRSISFGDYSILAGNGSQLWTHGYLHAPTGLDRFRIDGSIRVGNNVYIGSACVLTSGVRVADAITIGAASCVARSLDRVGLYVSQPLRFVELDYDQAASRHPAVSIDGLVERVVHKHIPKGP